MGKGTVTNQNFKFSKRHIEHQHKGLGHGILDISSVHIYGDSKVVIDYVRGKAIICKSSLQGWLQQITTIWSSLQHSSIQHISKDFNTEADGLSKKGIMEKLDGLHIEIKMYETWLEAGILPLPG